MPDSSNDHQSFFLIQASALLIISISLFIGGITLFFFKSDVWGLIFGLLAIQLGIACLIISFDNIVNKKIGPETLKIVNCSVCKKPTISPRNQENDICPECQGKITKALESN